MCQRRAIGILAVFVAINVYAAKMKLVYRETGDFHIGKRIF